MFSGEVSKMLIISRKFDAIPRNVDVLQCTVFASPQNKHSPLGGENFSLLSYVTIFTSDFLAGFPFT